MSKHTEEPKPKLFAEYDAADWGYKGWHLYLDDEAKTPVLVLLEPIGGQKNKHGRSPYQETHKDEIIAAYNNTYAAGFNPEAVPRLVEAFEKAVATLTDWKRFALNEDNARELWNNSDEEELEELRTALAAAKIKKGGSDGC